MANKSGGKPSDRRAGKRKDRNQRVGIRVPELGYYLIVTDTKETEKNYFEGLRINLSRFQGRNILRRIKIFTASWYSMGMRKRQFK